MRIKPSSLLLALWVFGVVLLGSGCSSAPKQKPAPGYRASVEIQNRDLQEIALTTMAVFREAGFHPAQPAGLQMVFERKAGGWDTVVHGDWSSSALWHRVKVDIVPIGSNYLVGCNVFRVVDKGNAHFEQEKKVNATGSHEYQNLLTQIKARVSASNPN